MFCHNIGLPPFQGTPPKIDPQKLRFLTVYRKGASMVIISVDF